MRYSILAVLMACAVLVSATASYAVAEDMTFQPRGRALVTGVEARDEAWDFITNLFITNISESDVTCRVTVYDHDGKDVSSLCNVFTGNRIGAPVQLRAGNGSFALPPGATRMVRIWAQGMVPVVFGHAVIEWTGADAQTDKALIAAIKTVRSGGGGTYGFMSQVNGGQPF
ncbi:hypothetical protein [Oleidesulfovibrio alaskensis]|uniref:hypothetical protein n=1 Tax=Oleidesulfovibrio alaskensis TaxID=58180 RepID=UPI001DB4CBB6|nr:hypothetical protein [Oleidesulfovibrio alaskensis]MBG0774165.1 hypothetical protein [Oleidesulfovibrio alaskensis]